MLDAGEQAARFVRVEGVVQFDDIVERGRGQRPVRHRAGDGGLQRDGRDRAAVLLVEVGLESDIPARDRDGRPVRKIGARCTRGNAAIERDLVGDIDRCGKIDPDRLARR